MVAIRSRPSCLSLSKVSSSNAINLRTCCLSFANSAKTRSALQKKVPGAVSPSTIRTRDPAAVVVVELPKGICNDQGTRISIGDARACRNHFFDILREFVCTRRGRSRQWAVGRQRQCGGFAKRGFGGSRHGRRKRCAVRPGQCRWPQQFRQRPKRRGEFGESCRATA